MVTENLKKHYHRDTKVQSIDLCKVFIAVLFMVTKKNPGNPNVHQQTTENRSTVKYSYDEIPHSSERK